MTSSSWTILRAKNWWVQESDPSAWCSSSLPTTPFARSESNRTRLFKTKETVEKTRRKNSRAHQNLRKNPRFHFGAGTSRLVQALRIPLQRNCDPGCVLMTRVVVDERSNNQTFQCARTTRRSRGRLMFYATRRMRPFFTTRRRNAAQTRSTSSSLKQARCPSPRWGQVL